MSKPRRSSALHGAGSHALTPSFVTPCNETSELERLRARVATLEALLLSKETQIVQQSRVLHFIKSLLRTSTVIGLVPSHLDRPARKGKGL